MSNPVGFPSLLSQLLKEDQSQVPGETNERTGKSPSSASPSNSQKTGVPSSSAASEMKENSNEKPVQHSDQAKDVANNTKDPAATNADDEKTNGAKVGVSQDTALPATDAANTGVSTPATTQTTQTPVAPHAAQKNNGQQSSSQARACGLVFVERVSRLPVVQCTAGVYRQAKASQALAGPLGLLELCAWACARPLQMAAAPLGDVCGAPLRAADWLLCRGLDATQVVFPCVNVHPAQMCGTTVHCFKDCICCCPKTVASTAARICSK